MVIGHNNRVVGLTGFSNKRTCGLLFGPQKRGRTKGVVVWRVSTVLKTTWETAKLKLKIFMNGTCKFKSVQPVAVILFVLMQHLQVSTSILSLHV